MEKGLKMQPQEDLGLGVVNTQRSGGAGLRGRRWWKRFRERRPEKEERTAGTFTYTEFAKCSCSRKTNVLFCGSSRQYFRQETETATAAQLRAIPSFCNKQGRCGISAVPLKFYTELSAVFQGCSFPLRSINLLADSLRNHGEFVAQNFLSERDFKHQARKYSSQPAPGKCDPHEHVFLTLLLSC